MLKVCGTCKQALPTAEFSRRAASRDGLQSRCKACWRLDYLQNTERRKTVAATNAAASLRRHRIRLASYLRDHPCVDCGESDIRCLDFDHRDPQEKLANVGTLVFTHVSWERVEREIAKCDVRCANCHRKRTSGQRLDWRHQQRQDDELTAARAAITRLQAIL